MDIGGRWWTGGNGVSARRGLTGAWGILGVSGSSILPICATTSSSTLCSPLYSEIYIEIFGVGLWGGGGW